MKNSKKRCSFLSNFEECFNSYENFVKNFHQFTCDRQEQ